MRFTGVQYLLVGLVGAFGCAASADLSSGGKGGAAGASGNGGSGVPKSDGGFVLSPDAARPSDASAEAVKANLTTDAITFNWDTHLCSGCSNGGGGGAGGGSTATPGSGGTSGGTGAKDAGGVIGMGGATVRSDASVGFGGSAAGGAMAGSGGRPAGGSTGGGAGGAAGGNIDAGAAGDAARSDASWQTDLPALPNADAAPDVVISTDSGVGAPDVRPADVVVPGCQAQIVPVVPALDRIDHVVAGENTRVVLRAVAVSGGPAAGATWSWSATWNGAALPVAQAGIAEPETAAFAIANPGKYTFTATSGACVAELPGFAVGPNECTVCDKSVVLRAAPPATSEVPMQSGALTLLGSAPFGQTNVILARGVAVTVSASIGTGIINSYVRINDAYGGLVVDGLADANAGGFVTRLRALDNNRSALKYDVLVVPLNGEDGATIAATAPQLYQAREPSSLNAPLALAGGVTITGTTVDVSGQPVADARVMLSNQDPSLAQQRRDLVFSSVGRSDSQGKYTLHVQQGSYWVSFFPPTDKGLSEVLSDSALSVGGGGTLSFQWAAATPAALSLTVVDSAGQPAAGVSVRVTSSSQSLGVGALSGSLVSSQQAKGYVQVEGSTDAAGLVAFPKLPANADYDVLLMPATPGPYAATTAATLRLDAAGTSRRISLLAQSSIYGKLVGRRATTVPIDLTSVSIVAYDRSADAPEAPRATMAAADGSFALGVTPNRSYVLVAVPEIGSGYAQTFVGPGPVKASEFVITQNLLGSVAWRATVMDENQKASPDTTLQVYCDPSWPNCVDATVPLAATTSDASGAFQLDLVDPATRL